MSMSDKRPLKFALLSHVLPPSPSGQAIVLSRILRGIDPAQYCLISASDYSQQGDAQLSVTQRLPAAYYSLPQENRLMSLAGLGRECVSAAKRCLRAIGKRALDRRERGEIHSASGILGTEQPKAPSLWERL